MILPNTHMLMWLPIAPEKLSQNHCSYGDCRGARLLTHDKLIVKSGLVPMAL